MHHTSANYGTVAQTTEIDLPAINDSYFTIQNNHFLPQRTSKILYAAAMGTLLTRCRISTPTLGVITSPFIRDISPALNVGNPQIFADYSADPLGVNALEEVVIFQTDSAVTSESNAAILGWDMGQSPQPAGTVFTIRGTATGTLVVGAWTSVGTITWQNQLPTGIYAVVGAIFQSAGAIAGRLILENTPYRPGGLAITTITNRTAPLFRLGGLGVWGQFHNYAMPLVEILSSSADTASEIYLDLMKIG
jgi:hypothetical protein